MTEEIISKKQLQQLLTKGVQFSTHVFDGHCWLSPDEVMMYLNDPDLFVAERHGVTKEQMALFTENYSSPHCHAFTKKQTPCRGFVHQPDSAKDFVAQGCVTYCALHEHLYQNREDLI